VPQYSLNRLTGAPIFTKSFKTDGETHGTVLEYSSMVLVVINEPFCLPLQD